ncbi:hypothetical protein GYMLUDRAFT_282397 [Collybiopsis luxurians FD-317 M1]|nr:hypothetical protein GYMLUDRAFT_282397 [Collybiopsis luxurians FD-317 M1]
MGQSHSSTTFHAPPKSVAVSGSSSAVGGNPQPQLMPHYNSPPNFTGVGRRASASVSSSSTPISAGASMGRGPSLRKGPLIFAAMATVPTGPQQPGLNTSSAQFNSASAYPSPPVEFASPLPKRQSRIVSGPAESSSDTQRENRRLSTTSAANTMKAQPPLPSSSSSHNLDHLPSAFRNASSSNQFSPPANSKRRSVLQKNGHNSHTAFENGSAVLPPPPDAHSNTGLNVPNQASAGASSSSHHRTLTKSRPQPPSAIQTPDSKMRPTTPPPKAKAQHAPMVHQRPTPPVSPENAVDRKTIAKFAGKPATVISVEEFEKTGRVAIPLDEDPFAKDEGVKMLPAKQTQESKTDNWESAANISSSASIKSQSVPSSNNVGLPMEEEVERRESSLYQNIEGEGEPIVDTASTTLGQVMRPITPPSPEQYRIARSRRRGDNLPQVPPSEISSIPPRTDRPAEPFPLALFLSNPSLLSLLLSFLAYWDWCNLFGVSKKIRVMFEGMNGNGSNELLKEEVLERFLRTVGYTRWVWRENEPVTLSLMDLHDYMRGVSLPTFEYARVAEIMLQQRSVIPSLRDPTIADKARLMISATRAYNRVLLRLRAQAERDPPAAISSSNPSPANVSRTSSRAPSPSGSSSHIHGRTVAYGSGHEVAPTSAIGFRSPLFRTGRAPLLRVFVPSPEGDWLSDASVLECEAELKRAGILGAVRMGDVVWDMAVGDEGNVGRMIWDGSYLIDLDYTYSTIGDLPKYIPGFAFPPSYFHRVIRTGGTSSSNPVVRLDITPWGAEIAANLQLLQDRVRTETPQGSYHNVVRWVHRSSFHLRPPTTSRRSPSHGRSSVRSGYSHSASSRIPIPNSMLFVDPGWHGKVVVETEGTNEALADLQDRCGHGVFPPRAASNVSVAGRDKEKEKDGKMVWRILRERSRPAEIWIRAVSPKERLM